MAKAANGNGNIRKRSNGTWEARYCVGTDSVTGKLIRKSVYGKTQKEVREKLRAATAAIDKQEYFEPAKCTVGQWLTIYEEEHLNSVKYMTAKSYKAQIETHIRPALGSMKLADLTPVIIHRFYSQLQKNGQTVIRHDENGKILRDKQGKALTERAPMSAKSVRNIHGVLTKCLSVAVDMDMIKSNPCERLKDKLPRTEKPEIKPLTDEQIKLFLQELKSEEYKRLFQVTLFLGLREMEAIGLTWNCVDFDAGTVTIKQQLIKRPKADGGYVLADTKSKRKKKIIRVIKAAPYVMDALKRRYAEQAAERLAAGDLWKGFQTESERATYFCFTTATGEHICPQTLYNHYKKIVARIGVPESRVHDLRHTCITVALQEGVNPKTVSENAGHYSVAFTEDVYGHLTKKMQEDGAAAMESYIQSAIS